MDRLEYIEAQAERLAAFRLETMELLNKRAHTLVSLLLGGGAGAGAYAAGLLERSHWAAAALGCASLWLFAVAALAVWKCLRAIGTTPPGNDPLPLLEQKGRPMESIREGCVRALAGRLDEWGTRNGEVGRWLNFCYLLAALTPVATALAVGSWAVALSALA